jgi:hypothetical protein
MAEKNDFESNKKKEIKDDIKKLEENINNMLNDFNLDDLEPSPDTLSRMEVANIELYDYSKDIEMIKIDAKDTLNCLANLYLTEQNMENKNIAAIIRHDANAISDLNWSISVTKRALIKCMNQLDLGSTNPDMFKAVTEFQKELRETIKSTNELLHVKMMTFYRDLKDNLDTLNTGQKEADKELNKPNTTIVDSRMLNDILDEKQRDHTLLSEFKLTSGSTNS